MAAGTLPHETGRRTNALELIPQLRLLRSASSNNRHTRQLPYDYPAVETTRPMNCHTYLSSGRLDLTLLLWLAGGRTNTTPTHQ